ncbi:DNA segregation ATPase FtsK/SpoIIIE-like protein [Rhabdobacter roseus]|uniref:DNA segregation ATPase FtsK/SpoIIIE-like protein n=1 Tax=Rhabdobacter roseus TaxID=1655419 RepID=A0A840TKW6_9BACT|nr:hypothetical protein [Rhabdobacter roseus]MBB5282447.1 DNA segregation ATPase FtsK/SpoIIIE-like protein [Rhabdobacter roseus]
MTNLFWAVTFLNVAAAVYYLLMAFTLHRMPGSARSAVLHSLAMGVSFVALAWVGYLLWQSWHYAELGLWLSIFPWTILLTSGFFLVLPTLRNRPLGSRWN